MVGSTRRVNSRLVKLRRGPSSATVCFRLANWECIVGRPLMPYTNAIRCRIWGTEHEVQAIRHSCARPPTTWPSVGQSCIGAYRHGTYQSHQIGVLWTWEADSSSWAARLDSRRRHRSPKRWLLPSMLSGATHHRRLDLRMAVWRRGCKDKWGKEGRRRVPLAVTAAADRTFV